MAKRPGFEERLERLEEIVAQLERGDIPLEEGVSLYREGLKQAKLCGKQLEAARNEVKVVSDDLLEEFGADGDDKE